MAKNKKQDKQKNQKVKKKKTYFDFYNENPPFDVNGYKKLGRIHIISEFLIYILFALFFAWGGYNLWEFGKYLYGNYGLQIDQAVSFVTPYIESIKNYSIGIILTIIIIFFICLGFGYLIVRLFAEIAAILMWGSLFIQTVLFFYLYWQIEWAYNWIFLIPFGINIILFTIWNKKFKKAIRFLKRTCLAVSKERRLLGPYLTQQLLIWILSFLYIFMIVGFTFNITNDVASGTYEIGNQVITLTGQRVFIFFTVLFIFLTYLTFNVTKAMKISMIHAWYRGDKVGFWGSYNIVKRRYSAIFTFSLLASVSRSIKVVKEILNGEWGPKTPGEIIKIMNKVRPVDMETMDKKERKKMSIWEKLFYYINYYTLYSITIENKPYYRSIFRSIHVTLRNIPQLYIKRSHVNKIFRLMQYSMVITNAIVGAIIGWGVARYFDLNSSYGAFAGLFLFLWIGGSSIMLILNDLNMAYKTIIYIHTIDDLYEKSGYTRFDLENPLSDEEMKQLNEKYDQKIKEKEVRLNKISDFKGNVKEKILTKKK